MNIFKEFFQPNLRNLDSNQVILGIGLAGISLGQALQINNGFINVFAIIFLTVSLIYLGRALFSSKNLNREITENSVFLILTAGLIFQIFQLACYFTGDYGYLVLSPKFWQFKVGIISTGAIALLSLLPKNILSSKQRTFLTLLTLIGVWLLGTWIIKTIPYPFIDVFVFHQTSSKALLTGINPYTLSTPNIYGTMEGYGNELVKNGFLTIGNPYPPISILFSAFGYFFGKDIRYSHLFAIVLSGALIAFLSPGRATKLAAYIFLFTPKLYYVVEQSWTEPIVILFLVATVFCAVHKPRWIPVMLGIFFASKQYLLFFFPITILLFASHMSWKKLLKDYSVIAITGILVTMPLALWNFSAFYWNVGAAQWYQVFRTDALSYLALYARIFDKHPSQLIAFIALLISFIPIWRYVPRTSAGFVTSLAWSLGVFFAFNKQAFCNYYFLVIGAICCGLALLYTSRDSDQTINIS